MENNTSQPRYRPPAEFTEALLALFEEFERESKRPIRLTITLEEAA